MSTSTMKKPESHKKRTKEKPPTWQLRGPDLSASATTAKRQLSSRLQLFFPNEIWITKNRRNIWRGTLKKWRKWINCWCTFVLYTCAPSESSKIMSKRKHMDDCKPITNLSQSPGPKGMVDWCWLLLAFEIPNSHNSSTASAHLRMVQQGCKGGLGQEHSMGLGFCGKASENLMKNDTYMIESFLKGFYAKLPLVKIHNVWAKNACTGGTRRP